LRGVTVVPAAGTPGPAGLPGGTDAKASLPAASPHALACGGTMIGPVWGEAVWNEGEPTGVAGGSGVSARFAVPPWQEGHGPPLSVRTARRGRGVPDIAALAAPAPGMLATLDGAPVACGGTALAATIWAALIARLDEGADGALGFITPRLYALPRALGAFNDIGFGGTETTGRIGGYFARPGYDACTGLGTPNGTVLLRALAYGADPGPGPTGAEAAEIAWRPLPGLAHDVAGGPDGTLWALGVGEAAGMRPLFRSSPAGWLHVPGAFGRALAMGRDGTLWLADAEGAIRSWDGNVWRDRPGRAASLAVAADGTLWTVAPAPAGQDGAVQHWGSGEPEAAGIAAHRVRPGQDGEMLLLNAAGEALRPHGVGWRVVARNVTDIACDAAGDIWAVSRTGGRIWRFDALDAAWCGVPDAIARNLVALPGLGLLAIQPNGAMFLGHPPARGPA
jgi:hypothetical protein